MNCLLHRGGAQELQFFGACAGKEEIAELSAESRTVELRGKAQMEHPFDGPWGFEREKSAHDGRPTRDAVGAADQDSERRVRTLKGGPRRLGALGAMLQHT